MSYDLFHLDEMSKTERDFIDASNFQLTARQLATLTYQLYDSNPKKQVEKLERLMSDIDNENLRDQIAERVYYIREQWAKLTTNQDNKYVYIIVHHNNEYDYDEIAGVFNKFEQATVYGIHRFENERFEIRKYDIVNGKLPTSTHKSVWNKGLFGDDNIEIVNEEYDGSSVGEAVYHNKECTYFYNTEDSIEDARRMDETDPKRFENAFIPLPHPFKNGDLVSMMGYDGIKYGVVEDSPESYEQFINRVKRGELFADFSDASITVDFIDEDGDFQHSHISPIFLEKVEWKSLPQSDNKTLLRYAMDLAMGEGALDFFLAMYEERHGRAKRTLLKWHESNDWE